METRSQRKRKSYNYRAAYFRKNPGLFGCVWFCSQCGIPLFGKENVQVDHIVPLAGAGINRTINTVAICPACNRKKGAKGGMYVVKGGIAKVGEVTLFSVQKIFLYFIVGILYVLNLIKEIVIGVLLAPFKYASLQTQLIVVIVYVLILLFIVSGLFAR